MKIDMYPSDEIISQNEMIDSFLRGQMSEIEEEKFKRMLNEDEEFKKRAFAAAMMAKGMKSVGEEQDEESITKFRLSSVRQIKDAIQGLKPGEADEQIPAAASFEASQRSPMFKIITAAASVLLVAYIGYEGYNYHQTTSLGVEYAQPFDASEMRSDADLQIQQEVAQLVNNVYEGKELKQALSRLDEVWNKTIISTGEGSNVELNFESDYYDYAAEIGWALATGRLKNNQKKEAILVLKQMASLYAADTAMGKKVRQLKQKITK